MSGDFSVVDPDDVEPKSFLTCDVQHRKLTKALGCTETRLNTITLEPGEATTPHAHEGQEELYVALTGGRVEIDDDVHDVPEGGVVRVGPDPIRSLRNDSDDVHRWVAVGAPPVGSAEDFGNTVLPGDESL